MTNPRPDPRKLKLLVEILRGGRFTYDDLAEHLDAMEDDLYA